jgi:multidrug efflux pump subunit AcrA (membrane-fusion protein)
MWVRGKWAGAVLCAVLVVSMWIPVRLTALAPAEVIALNALSVAAPQDGVIHSIAVQPNATVKAGDLLFTLDDTTITNRHEVAGKAVAVARAEALVAEQRAFDDPRGKADLAASLGRLREKEAELASLRALMARIEVRASQSGIAVYGDPNDWIGKPVQTGERVMQLADPKDAGLQIWLPVKDAINLDEGAEIRLFLHTKTLEPITAHLQQTSYQAVQSPDNVASYRVKAQFAEGEELPRIGLRGTARISGAWSILGYYLFRRPIAAVREWTGL